MSFSTNPTVVVFLADYFNFGTTVRLDQIIQVPLYLSAKRVLKVGFIGCRSI